jgi:hypothetical protein
VIDTWAKLWKGIIYPEFGGINYLKEYSKYYNIVEAEIDI